MTARNLRDAGQMIGPAVDGLGEALDAPVSDAPLLALARRFAATIDAMSNAEAVTMLPNHAGPLIKVLAELETRAQRRRSKGTGRANKVAHLRAAHATATAKRDQAG